MLIELDSTKEPVGIQTYSWSSSPFRSGTVKLWFKTRRERDELLELLARGLEKI